MSIKNPPENCEAKGGFNRRPMIKSPAQFQVK